MVKVIEAVNLNRRVLESIQRIASIETDIPSGMSNLNEAKERLARVENELFQIMNLIKPTVF